MKPPPGATLFETPISTHWMDENGIMCAVSKKVERTVPHYQKVMEVYQKNIVGDNKLCLLASASNTMPLSKEVTEFIVAEMPKYIKAHAVISEVPLSTTLTNTFIKLNWAGFPVKHFSNEEDAKKWLKEFL